jgi:mannose/fructose/N-acetylgalactosamine-specific phosphotransferase system component IID
LLRLEKEFAADPQADPGTVKRFKDSLGRALASLGDQLFWLGLQPSLMLIAAVFVMLDRWPAALALFIAFGVLEVAFRFHSLKHGHELGMDIVDLLGSPVWHKAIKWAGRCGSIATGVMVALAVHPASGGMRTEGWALFVMPLIALLSMVLRRHMPGESIMLLLVPLALLLAYL